MLAKLDEYGSVFADDFAGTNSRSKKTLWLTEVAAATSDIAVLVPFVNSLMSTSAYFAVARAGCGLVWSVCVGLSAVSCL